MSLPVCPDGCNVVAPIVNTFGCESEFNYGEVRKLYFSAVDFDWQVIIDDYLTNNPGSTYEDAYAAAQAAWCQRVSNSSTDQNAIRELCIRGEKPESTKETIEVCGGIKVYSELTHTLTFNIDDTGTVNYDALRQFECNGIFYVWYEDEKYLYGSACCGQGIKATIPLNHIIPISRTELQTFTGTIEWDDKHHPCRIEKFSC